MVDRAARDAHRFVWTTIASPEEMGRLRMESMLEFLTDYEAGKGDGRYVAASLPRLGFGDGSFELALCSHFLFLYSDEFDVDYHVESIQEMLRVADDVRIFPLLDMRGNQSQHVPIILDKFDAEIVNVDYEFQKGGNQMLRLKKR